MATTSFRILQRRSSTSGVTPQLCTLCDGELFVQLADETIYFRNNENQLVCTLTDKNLGNLYNIFAPTGDYVTNSQTGAFASIGNYVTTSQTGDLSSVFAPTGNYVTATQTGNLSSVFAPTGNYAVIVDGHIPAQYLPSYVDDVQEFNTITGLCAHAGEKGHIYLVSGCNSFWRWGGSQYVEIYASPGTSDGLVEGSTNLYFTAARSAGYVTTGSAANFVTTCQTGVFALSANTGNFETTGYARNCYVTTGETGSFLVGKIGTNINLGDSSNKSRLNEKSFLGAGVCNNQSGICCSFLGASHMIFSPGIFAVILLMSKVCACPLGRKIPTVPLSLPSAITFHAPASISAAIILIQRAGEINIPASLDPTSESTVKSLARMSMHLHFSS